MPKARFTLSDVAAMSREVLERCGDWRVAQVYDGDGRSFVFKLQQSGEAGKRLLLLESGTKFLVTKYDAREGGGDMPSGLCSKLRQRRTPVTAPVHRQNHLLWLDMRYVSIFAVHWHSIVV